MSSHQLRVPGRLDHEVETADLLAQRASGSSPSRRSARRTAAASARLLVPARAPPSTLPRPARRSRYVASIPIAPAPMHERAPQLPRLPARRSPARAGARARRSTPAPPARPRRPSDSRIAISCAGSSATSSRGEAVQARDAALAVVAGQRRSPARPPRTAMQWPHERRTVAVTRSPRVKPWPSRSTTAERARGRARACSSPSGAIPNRPSRDLAVGAAHARPRASARAPRPRAPRHGAGTSSTARVSRHARLRDERLHSDVRGAAAEPRPPTPRRRAAR